MGGARGARAALRQGRHDRRGRHAPRRARRHRRRGGRLHGRERRGDPARRASTSPTTLHERTMGELQGGQKVRVLLAQALFGHPQALLLDEPTNHLDLDSIHWLREFLVRYDGTLIVISHDRHFLNAVCTHIADIDYQTIITYTGGYDDMVVAKTQIRSRIESRERAAREEDRAAQRLHRALLGRHAREPGAVAAQGSRAAADDRAGAVEHPAPVHQVRDERGRRAGWRSSARASPRRTAAPRSSRTSTPSSTAARRSSSSAATASARRRCSRRCWPTRRACRPSPARHRSRHRALGPRGVDRLLPAGPHRRDREGA